MTPPVDPNEVLMTGENSFVRLSPDGGKTMSDRFSHWRVLWCPAGAGHALFARRPPRRQAVRIYSDNAAVARWLQRTIETLLYPGVRRHEPARVRRRVRPHRRPPLGRGRDASSVTTT